MSRLNWEINNRVKWDKDVARRSPHAARQPLTDAEIESRRLELQQLARSSLAWRAFTYFMGCFACQVFWTALAVFAITRGVSVDAGMFTSAACSGAAVLMTTVQGLTISPRGAERATGAAGCKNCGK